MAQENVSFDLIQIISFPATGLLIMIIRFSFILLHIELCFLTYAVFLPHGLESFIVFLADIVEHLAAKYYNFKKLYCHSTTCSGGFVASSYVTRVPY